VLFKHLPDEVAPDEPKPAGYKESHTITRVLTPE
jgi:hypothetical protein